MTKNKKILQNLATLVLSQSGGETIRVTQQDISIRSMKYVVELLVPDGKYQTAIGKWHGGSKKEAIKQAKIYSEKYGWYNKFDELVPAPIEYEFLEKKKR
jgi:hypothetical protein